MPPAPGRFSTTTDCLTTSDSFALTRLAYTLTPPSPSKGDVEVASGAFTVTPNGSYTGTVTITPSGGGLSTPIVLSFSGTLLAILPAVFVGSIINGPITDGDKSALATDLFVLLAVAVVGFLAMWFGGRLLAVAAQDAMHRLRREVFEHTQTLSLRFFDRQPIGDLMSLVTNDLDSVNAKLTPQPVGTYLQPIKLSGARDKVAKKTYIRAPRYPVPSFDKALAECKADKSWNTLEVTDSGHIVMLDVPGWLAETLVQAS